MGERAAEAKDLSADEIDRLANLSDDEMAGELRKLHDPQLRAIAVRRIKARQNKWKKNATMGTAPMPRKSRREKDNSSMSGATSCSACSCPT